MTKKRVSTTLSSDLVKKIDRKVINREFPNRSQAIEQMVKDYLHREKVTKAVILAGGNFSGDIPDAMINYNGKPLLEHILNHLKEQGIERIIITISKEHDKIPQHFGNTWNGLKIDYEAEEEPLGTAGCLRNIKDKLKDTFVVLNGDVLCKIDLKDMIALHRRNKSPATITLTTIEDSSPYGVVRLKGERVVGFVEKPSKEEAPSNLINAGVYLLEPEVINSIPNETPVDMPKLLKKLVERKKLCGYVYEGQWRDIGT